MLPFPNQLRNYENHNFIPKTISEFLWYNCCAMSLIKRPWNNISKIGGLISFYVIPDWWYNGYCDRSWVLVPLESHQKL